MRTLPNLLSASRFFLALCFLVDNIAIRICAIALALISDFLDGYLARKNKWTSKAGAILDPIADRFFIFFVLFILMAEKNLAIWQIAIFFARDISLGVFALYLFKVGAWKTIKLEATWCGKISTVLQFFLLLAIALNIAVGPVPYLFLLLLAAMNWVELCTRLQAKA